MGVTGVCTRGGIVGAVLARHLHRPTTELIRRHRAKSRLRNRRNRPRDDYLAPLEAIRNEAPWPWDRPRWLDVELLFFKISTTVASNDEPVERGVGGAARLQPLVPSRENRRRHSPAVAVLRSSKCPGSWRGGSDCKEGLELIVRGLGTGRRNRISLRRNFGHGNTDAAEAMVHARRER